MSLGFSAASFLNRQTMCKAFSILMSFEDRQSVVNTTLTCWLFTFYCWAFLCLKGHQFGTRAWLRGGKGWSVVLKEMSLDTGCSIGSKNSKVSIDNRDFCQFTQRYRFEVAYVRRYGSKCKSKKFPEEQMLKFSKTAESTQTSDRLKRKAHVK